jgi:shikimate dehydrogenase
MDIYGLVGKSLPHTLSPVFFNKKFTENGIDAEYRVFEIDKIEELETIIAETENLKGLNITVPYKRSLAHLVDVMSKGAMQTGSINTLKFSTEKGKITTQAFNTDIDGFEKSITPYIYAKSNIKALILGTGGAAHTASYVFRRLGIFYYFVSRNPVKVEHLGYDWITKDILNEFNLIINCTPLGMYPDVETAPKIPYGFINTNNTLFDCVYNPENTVFLKRGKMNGAQTISGRQMFEIQANENWKIWMKD